MQHFRRKILYPLLVASLLLAITMAWLFFAAYNVMTVSHKQNTLDALRFNIIKLENTIVAAETRQRGYLLTDNVEFLHANENAQQVTAEIFNEVALHYAAVPELKPGFDRLRKLTALKFEIIDTSVQIQLHSGAYASHLSMIKDQGKAVMDSISAELDQVDKLLVARRNQDEQRMNASLKQAIFGSLILALIIVVVLIMSYRRTVSSYELAIESRIKAEKFGYEATHDPLTKLSNRRDFDQMLKKIHIISKRKSDQYAVLYLDLDGFKRVNDRLGHDAGDVVLVKSVERFMTVLRQSDFLARRGGDEFAMIVHRYKDATELEHLANRIIASLRLPFFVESKNVHIGVSIGIACYPDHASSVNDILAAADAAMYQSKHSGKNTYTFATRADSS